MYQNFPSKIILKDLSIEDIPFHLRVLASNSKILSQNQEDYQYIPEETIKNGYIKYYGPDSKYDSDEIKKIDIDRDYNCDFLDYDPVKKEYKIISNCPKCKSEEVCEQISVISVPYKAEHDGDYIYVYHNYLYELTINRNSNAFFFFEYPKNGLDYTISNNYINGEWSELADINMDAVVFFNNQDNRDEILGSIKYHAKQNKYKYTFKKQTDGRYYYFGGEKIN